MIRTHRRFFDTRHLRAQDLDLLRMALGPEATRLEALARWRGEADFQSMNAASLLVPAAFAAVQDSAPPCAVVSRMRGAYRKTWLQGEVTRERLSDLTGAVVKAGLDVTETGDMCLATAIYPKPATRPVFQIGLMVRSADLPALREVCTRQLGRAKAADLWALNDVVTVRVSRAEAGLRGLGDGLRPASGLRRATPTLLFWHALSATRPHPLLRALDLGMIVQRHAPELDWAALARTAGRGRGARALRDTLAFLDRDIGVDNAREGLTALAGCAPTAPPSVLRQLWHRRSGPGSHMESRP